MSRLILVCVSLGTILAGVPLTWGASYPLSDGTFLVGEPVSFGSSGVVVKKPNGSYAPRVEWTNFAQEALKMFSEEPRAKRYVELYVIARKEPAAGEQAPLTRPDSKPEQVKEASALTNSLTDKVDDHEQRIRTLESELRELKLKLGMSGTATESTKEIPRSPASPPFSSSVGEFIDENRKNAVAFTLKYKNKPIKVTGVIAEIRQDSIELSGGFGGEIKCSFADTELAAVARLSRDKSVSIIGVYRGEIDLGLRTPVLEDCKIVDATAK